MSNNPYYGKEIKKPEAKFVVFAGHDNGLECVMAALLSNKGDKKLSSTSIESLGHESIVPFGASLLIELYWDKKNNKHLIQIMFDGHEILFSGWESLDKDGEVGVYDAKEFLTHLNEIYVPDNDLILGEGEKKDKKKKKDKEGK